MATYKKGDWVKTTAVIPQGPVEGFRMDDEGNVFYQITWTDADGVEQTRWFAEDELQAV